MENYNQNQPPRNATTEATSNSGIESSGKTQQHEFRKSPVTPTRDLAGDLIEVFKLLADETRLRILLLLFEKGELNVRSLCDKLDQSQPGVSHHLSLLRLAGFIERRREGKSNYYHVFRKSLKSFSAYYSERCQAVLLICSSASSKSSTILRFLTSSLALQHSHGMNPAARRLIIPVPRVFVRNSV